ncbi:MAG: histidine kinase dimerization/phospho-acceptor domain-containing protein, partial [Bacteroidota bacterium]
MDQTQNKAIKKPSIGEYLFGSAIDFSLEHRFFNATCLFSIVVASVSTIFNTLLILDILLISMTLAAVLMFVYLYYKSRVKKLYKTWMLMVYVFFTLSSFVFIWFFNAGIFGPNGYILIILSGFVIILVSKKYTFTFIAIFTLYALGLIFVEYFFPNISISYESEDQRFFDFAWTISISIIILTLGISVLKNNYRSERQENLEQREEAKEKYLLVQSMLRSSPDAIIITDLQGLIVDCNEQTPLMFGHSGIDEIIGINAWETFISRSDYLRALTNQRKTTEGAPSKNIEYKAHSKTDNEFYIEVSSNVVNDASGKPMYIVNTARDISERVTYEDGLRAARKKAEELNQAKSVFLAKISHELRTPLNGVLGFSDLLLDQENDPDRKAMIENIRYSGNTLLRLINDILDLSRIESQKLSFEQQTFNFPTFLDSIKNKYDRVSEENRITFSIQQIGSIPENINSDPLRIEQVLVNLLNNAFKFTNKGEIKLTVAAEKLSFHKSELIFTVSDTG